MKDTSFLASRVEKKLYSPNSNYQSNMNKKSRIEDKLNEIRNSISHETTPIKRQNEEGRSYVSKNLKEELENYKKDILGPQSTLYQ